MPDGGDSLSNVERVNKNERESRKQLGAVRWDDECGGLFRVVVIAMLIIPRE